MSYIEIRDWTYSMTPADSGAAMMARCKMARSDAPVLLTPGPLTTAPATRQAMLRDWGSRDTDFIALNRAVRAAVLAVAAAGDSHACVPLQGSGTFAVEAMLGTFVPKPGRLLILINGAYGRRMARICEYIGR